jgi:hypothetical protein
MLEIVPLLSDDYGNVKSPDLLRATLAGLLTAACAYNMHPETFACAAGLAALLGFSQEYNKAPSFETVKKSLAWIAVAAVIAFCASAPLILPLLEFIGQGSSYKFAAHQIEHIQLSDFLKCLFLPGAGGNSYFGVVLGLALPMGMIIWRKQSPLLLLALVALSVFSFRPSPVEEFLAGQPWCYLLPEYTFYAALLLIVLCAGTGLDQILTRTISSKVNKIVTALVTISCLCVLISQTPLFANFLPRVSDLAEGSLDSMPTLASSVILTVIWFSSSYISESRTKFRAVILAILSCGNALLLTALVPKELGVRPAFSYAQNAITQRLQRL